jgi:hypothetical protein
MPNTEDLDLDLHVDSWVVRHQVEHFVQRTSARINNFSDIYFQIAQDEFADYLVAVKDPALAFAPEEHLEELTSAEDRLDQSAVKTIVFAAMTCEAAIYDIAAIHLSDDYARDVLDKLDPVSKWLVAPRLICGTSLRSDGPAINALRTLFGARNELVHAKSQSGLGLNDPAQLTRAFEATRKQGQKIKSAVVPAYHATVLLSLELERLFGTSISSLPRFSDLKHSRAFERASEGVKEAIRRCKEIDANFLKKAS